MEAGLRIPAITTGRFRLGRSLALALVALSLATCGGSAITSSPSAQAAAISSPPSAPPSVAPSSPASNCNLPAPPAGGSTMTTTKPALHADLPEGYRQLDIADYRRQLAAVAAQVSDPDVKKDFEKSVRLLDSGAILAVGQGRAPTACALVGIGLRIRDTAASLDRALAAWRGEHDALSTTYRILSRKTLRIGVGPALRMIVRLKGHLATSVASRSIVYLVLLEDHRVLEFGGTAPFSDTAVDPLLDAIVESLQTGS
jgi:hypothetical protein